MRCSAPFARSGARFAKTAARAQFWSATTHTFDLGFLNKAIERSAIKRNPFHPFSCFDTATLCGVAFGQTVLARAAIAGGLGWDETQAHSASYDAEQTADLFCEIVNRFRDIFETSLSNAPPQP